MINRDTAVKNKPVLKTAAEFLTLRTSVPTAQMHVQALYDFMNLSIPGTGLHICALQSLLLGGSLRHFTFTNQVYSALRSQERLARMGP